MKPQTVSGILLLIVQLFIFQTTNQAQKTELVVQTGHSGMINSVDFSPDGKLLASGGNDRIIKLWEVETGREIRTFIGHLSVIYAVKFSPDGKILASAGADKTVKLWDIQSGKELKTLKGHTLYVQSVDFSSDGKFLASAGDDKTVKLWDTNTGQEVRTINGHKSAVNSVVFSPNGKLLASSDKDGSIKLWNVETGGEIKTLAGHSSSVNAITFSPDGKKLASISEDKTVKLWDTATGKTLQTISEESVFHKFVAFSPDGKSVLTGQEGFSQPASIWDVETGKKIISISSEAGTEFNHGKFSPDGKIVAGGDNLNQIIIGNAKTGKEMKFLAGRKSLGNTIDFSPDGKTLASADSWLKLWHLDENQLVENFAKREDGIFGVQFNPNGKTLVGGNSNGKGIKVWESKGGKELLTFDTEQGAAHRIVKFDTEGKFVAASAGANQTVDIWNAASGKLLRSLGGHSSIIWSVAFSPDKKTLAVGSYLAIKLWDFQNGKELKTLKVPMGVVFAVAFSPDGKTLATASYGTIKLWDVASGSEIKTLDEGYSAYGSLAFSPDGKTLLAGNEDRTMRFWDVATGSKTGEISTNHNSMLTSTIFSPDGKLIASAGSDNTIKLWDAATRKEICSLISLNDEEWVVITPDGRFDTNKSLDNIEGLHWIIADEPLKPKPLEIFMRQYYEPNLLQRVLKNEQFKPLPSIAEINRVQPLVTIKEIKPAANSGATTAADVIIEVENVQEKSADKARQISSGAFDLRLFRDGQLVGVATPKINLEKFIADAPRLVEETKTSGKLINTPEDAAWRETNDIFALRGENIKKTSPTKIEYTFRSVRLPKDGRKEVEFTAYAFNADKVKSATTAPVKFTVPNSAADVPKKGRAVVVSIGVNASENPAFDLRYAANDARKMQEIVGARLTADAAKYSEIVQIPLISDYGTDKKLRENAAQKIVIRGVFSLLAGNKKEVSPEILAQIPNREKIRAIEPEDTLIITYSGHGYADRSGIFYLLPYDIGKETKNLTPDVLRRMISSDELSLWMQNITAAEMIMVIDACHSAAAVQGAGFKPGPMGSRGLGQLAYDKDMKILSATQANNVALELNSLEQGLLSYALLQDGIVSAFADADKDKRLFSDEWLSYAERRVPELYEEVKAGKRGIIIDGRNIGGDRARSELSSANSTEIKSNLQQPSLFDFKRRKYKNNLFVLP